MARYDGVEFGHRTAAAESLLTVDEMYAKSRQEAFNEIVRRRILAGNFFLLRQNYQFYYEQALKIRRLIADEFFRAFQSKVDVILAPVTSGDPPWFSQFSKDDRGYDRERNEDYCTNSKIIKFQAKFSKSPKNFSKSPKNFSGFAEK